MLRLNDYPENFINYLINEVNNNHKISNVKCKTEPPPLNSNVNSKKRERFFSIPFIGKPSIFLKKHLSKLDPNFKITFSSHGLNYKYFSKVKDPVPPPKCSGLVYSIPCDDCHGVQLLENRLAQHKRDVSAKRKSTALCEHTTETGHNINVKKASILCFEENDKKRKVREAVEILKHDEAINFKTDVHGVIGMYSPILKDASPR